MICTSISGRNSLIAAFSSASRCVVVCACRTFFAGVAVSPRLEFKSPFFHAFGIGLCCVHVPSRPFQPPCPSLKNRLAHPREGRLS